MLKQRNNSFSTINKGVQKENLKIPENKQNKLEDCDLNDRKFKIVVLKKINKIQENS